MKSFRLIFVDVDESFTTSTVEAPIKGYMVCRAPKGTTEATYFPYGNEKTINAMIGLQTANWPDLYEAVAFNSEYGLYISAPPGTSKNYPSYYGGVYLTTKSMYNYWRVDDKDNPSYEVQVYPGYEDCDFDSSISPSEISIPEINTSSTRQGVIQITNVSPALIAKLNYMNLKSWQDNGTGLDEGDEVAYHFDNGLIYAVVDDVDTESAVGYYMLTAEGTYTIVFGAVSQQEVNGTVEFTKPSFSATTYGVPFLNFMNIFNYGSEPGNDAMPGFIFTDGENRSQINPTVELVENINGLGSLKGEALIEQLLLKGSGGQKFTLQISAANNGGNNAIVKTFSPIVGIEDRLYYRVNIKNDCFLRISQKSPNETPTSITLSNIGYDKYLYDINVKYILKKDFESDSSQNIIGLRDLKKMGESAIHSSGIKPKVFLKDLAASNDKYIIDVIASEEESKWLTPEDDRLHSLWQYDVNAEVWTDVTPDYKTKNIYVSGPLICSGYDDDFDHMGEAYSSESGNVVNAACTGTIWYVANTAKPGKYGHQTFRRSLGGTYKLQSDINYNTVTISCKEQVYPGQYMSGGEWTGSLSETGVSADGVNIYWPNVLSSSDASFIEVTPVHTFDELGVMDDKGFFTGEKIIDIIGPAQDVKTFTIKGQRTMTNAVQANIDAGTLGCAWTQNALPNDDEARVDAVFTAAIKDGIIEAQQNSYDDALVFMECSKRRKVYSKE